MEDWRGTEGGLQGDCTHQGPEPLMFSPISLRAWSSVADMPSTSEKVT